MRSYFPFILPLPSIVKSSLSREREDDRLVERVPDKRGEKEIKRKRNQGTAAVPSSSDKSAA